MRATHPLNHLAWTVATLALLAAGGVSANPTPELIFSAPPRGNLESENRVYKPVAEYLSKKLGRKVVYRHIDNWLSYQSEMRKGRLDIVFDGPHFLSWRMAMIGHEPVAKLPGKLAFVAVVKIDDKDISSVDDLAGHPVCGLAPPNLATLTFLDQFDKPARQPRIVNIKSFPLGYKSLLAGKCRGAILRDNVFKKLDGQAKKTRLIYQSKGIANQAFSAGPRLTAAEKSKIAQALVSPEAKIAIKTFLERYTRGKDLVAANNEEFRAHAHLLKDTWGFELKTVEAKPGKPAPVKYRKK